MSNDALQPDATQATGRRSALVAAVRHMLQPLVRLLIAQGITYPFLADLLKSIYVEVANRDFQLPGRAQTDSRLRVLTGLHRQEVKRLLAQQEEESGEMPGSVSLGAELVSRWISQPDYVDSHQRPAPLPRLASQGGDASFEGLVASVSKDIRSRAVLDEWLRLGVVHIDEQDRVCLNAEAFVPREDFEAKTFYLGHHVHDHIAAAAHNVAGAEPAFLERSVSYDELGEGSIDRLAKLAEDHGMKAINALNREAMKLEEKDAVTELPKQRFTFGIYFYSAPATPPAKDGE